MWYLTLIPILLIGRDYMKAPIDNLYFNNWRRPFIGMRNTLIDVLMHSPEYSVWQFKGLHLIQKHYRDIRKEFEDVSKTLDKTMYHDLDVWFDKNDKYNQTNSMYTRRDCIICSHGRSHDHTATQS